MRSSSPSRTGNSTPTGNGPFRLEIAVKAGENLYPFDPTLGPGYVWHCHILDHEDNDMMRPMAITKKKLPSLNSAPGQENARNSAPATKKPGSAAPGGGMPGMSGHNHKAGATSPPQPQPSPPKQQRQQQ